jgi:hypothetical protein
MLFLFEKRTKTREMQQIVVQNCSNYIQILIILISYRKQKGAKVIVDSRATLRIRLDALFLFKVNEDFSVTFYPASNAVPFILRIKIEGLTLSITLSDSTKVEKPTRTQIQTFAKNYRQKVSENWKSTEIIRAILETVSST